MKCPHCQKTVLLVKDTSNCYEPEYATDDNGRVNNFEGTGDTGELLERIDDDSLTGAAVDFVATTRARYEQYGDRIKLSPKQVSWLRRLAGQ